MAQARNGSVAAPEPYVLIVDDVLDNREMYAEYLRFSGLRAETAETAEEALEMARREPPAVVVMDLALPEMDGLEATRRLKADPRTGATRVIVVSGHAVRDQAERAIAAGAEEFCSKPFLPLDLLAKVQALMPAPDDGSGAPTTTRTRRRK